MTELERLLNSLREAEKKHGATVNWELMRDVCVQALGLQTELAFKNRVLDYIWEQVQDPNELNDTWFGGKDASHTLATIVSNIDDKLRRIGYVNTEKEDE